MFDSSWFPASFDRAITPGVGNRDEITWTLATFDMAAFIMFYYFNDDTVAHTVTMEHRPVDAALPATLIQHSVPAATPRSFLPPRITGVSVEARVSVPWFVMAPSVVTFRDLTPLVTVDRVPRFGVRWMEKTMVSKGNPVVPVVVTI